MTETSIQKSQEEVKHLVFCYGSLRTGEYNHALLENSIKIADGWVRGYELVSLGVYPAVVPNPESNVVGELFHVDPNAFRLIDSMERDAGYRHDVVNVYPLTGDREDPNNPGHITPLTNEAWIYVHAGADWLASMPRVASGDWALRHEVKHG